MSTGETYTVAVLGATGLVGSHLLSILEERQFPVKQLKALSSAKSAGSTVRFNNENITVEEAIPDSFDGVDIVLASAGGSISQKLVPEAVKRGATVIDNTSCFRLDRSVPLVVGGVNDDDLQHHQGIIANPNCSTAQLMPILKALDEAAGLERVIISTYQSVSGAGKNGMDELLQSTREFINRYDNPSTQSAMSQNKVFQRPIAFNLIPHIDVFMEDGLEAGYTKEETKLIHESRKILGKPNLRITATAVRVPVLVSHSESITVELANPLSPEQATALLSQVPDVVVSNQLLDYPTPLDSTGKDPVYVGRIRRDTSNPETGLNLWVVADNLRIGAALNAVRIAESLVKNNWVKSSALLAS